MEFSFLYGEDFLEAMKSEYFLLCGPVEWMNVETEGGRENGFFHVLLSVCGVEFGCGIRCR